MYEEGSSKIITKNKNSQIHLFHKSIKQALRLFRTGSVTTVAYIPDPSDSMHLHWLMASQLVLLAHRSSSFSSCFLLASGRSRVPVVTTRMSSSLSSSCSNLPSVSEFLKGQTAALNDEGAHLSVGNPAGDADSIISAIAVAYIDSTLRRTPTFPIVSIPHDDLKTQRPETNYLLQLAGIRNVDDLMAVDHPQLPTRASVTLVDHNQLVVLDNRKNKDWEVTQILDHHLDEGAHTDITDTDRNIAFETSSSAALVASTCTLLVERWLSSSSTSPNTVAFPPSLSILLLGVILLDSINMLPQAGKGTERDALAIHALQSQTDWSVLGLPAALLEEEQDDGRLRPNPTRLFDTLQAQKFSPAFWNALTAEQALKLDYKSFGVPNHPHPPTTSSSTTTATFGVASVLQRMEDFLQKPRVLESIRDSFFSDDHTNTTMEFFGIMFFSVLDDGTPRRQLVLACPNAERLNSLVSFLQEEEGSSSSSPSSSSSLQLDVLERKHDDTSSNLHVVYMNQGNARASRKQVAPLLMEYFKQPQRMK
jgi:exopolyphosphatase